MKRQVLWQPPVILVVLAVFFTILFYADNKYQTPPPYGKSGVITLSEGDLERDTPIFLIDGWLLTDEHETDKPTYIGEFSNLQRGELSISPHGWARYQLTLRYEGEPGIVSVDFPQLSMQYVIALDGTRLTEGEGNGRITFLLTPGDHVLVVETSSKLGYYSGMYFPPALGTVRTLSRVSSLQSFAYALAFLLPLVLAAFTLFLWRTGGSLSRWFAVLCGCYALYMVRYFVFLFAMPVLPYWFFVQSLALYCLCFCVVKLTVLASGRGSSSAWRLMSGILLAFSAVLLVLALLTSILPWAVVVHGRLTDIYYVLTFGGAAFFTVRGIRARSWESGYTMAGCAVFGVGLLVNLLFSNRFEPIRFFWQFEWCGLFLVLLFGVMMVFRNRRVLRENEALTNHLEEQVKKRTEEVTQLLNERKAFFSDMAHDLKAPVFATQSFIEAIRRSSVGVDTELRGYLDQAEAKQREMARRLQGLSTINALDKIEGERVRVSLQEMLAEIYAIHHGEAEVQSVYLIVEPPQQDAFLLAQPEKINILFENLIYNALKATPRNGSIRVSARVAGDKISMSVADTGCGIPEEDLPLIFRRFYVGANNRKSGTGLGLYIVHSIVTELGGTINVRSTVGMGTEFMMEFPRVV
ncbi:MAG: HAMP domain-containing histidine kinase [Lachnospiraceae bacterium]|nr:HAMP domain-containing histidine kinase [Lachnospiraceae bacterium]